MVDVLINNISKVSHYKAVMSLYVRMYTVLLPTHFAPSPNTHLVPSSFAELLPPLSYPPHLLHLYMQR